MRKSLSGPDYSEYQPGWPFGDDPMRDAWLGGLKDLSISPAQIREAIPDGPDGRRMRDLQAACSPLYPQLIRDNVSAIAEKSVLLAEIDEVHVGFCLSFAQPSLNGYLIVQVIAVVEEAQRRGVGSALLSAAAAAEPNRDLAFATQSTNKAALSMVDRFASSIGATVRKVNLGTFRDRDLGIKRGVGYRSFVVERGIQADAGTARG